MQAEMSRQVMASTEADMAKPKLDDVTGHNVELRGVVESLRKSRHKRKERTPTTVVSEAFAFLQNPCMSIESEDESDEGDECQNDLHQASHVDKPGKWGNDGEAKTNSTNGPGVSFKDQEVFLAGFQSKDSGFASLERHGYEGSKNPINGYFVEDGDHVSNNDCERENSLTHPRNSDSCWEDVGASDQNQLMHGSCSEAGDAEYDDVDVAGMPLRRKDSEYGRKSAPPLTVTVEADNMTNSGGSHSKLNTDTEYLNGHHEATPHGNGNSDGSGDHDYANINAVYGGKKVNISEDVRKSCQVLMDTNNIERTVLTVDFTKSEKMKTQQDSGVYNTGGLNSGDEKFCSSGLLDSYYNIDIANDGLIAARPGLTSVSSDDEEENNEDMAAETSGVSNMSEQDYDTISLGTGHCPREVDVGLSPSMIESQDVHGDDELSDSFQGQKIEATDDGIEVSRKAPTDPSGERAGNVVRRHKLEKNPSAEAASDDSSDEDIGVYAESFRRSNWIRVSQEGKIELQMPYAQLSEVSISTSPSASVSTPGLSTADSVDYGDVFSPKADEVFVDPLSQTVKAKLFHKRSDSLSTTVSESEFKRHYVSRRKCLIQRADSQQEYHRLSARVYDQDKQVIIERIAGCDDLGLHLLNSHPAFITSVDPDSPADRAGVVQGQILVTVNEHNVLTMDHTDIVKLIQESEGNVKLGVANSDFQPVRDLQAPVMSGYISKLGNSSFMKIWKKRYFILRQDNCLYYYKNDQENDPLGALPLCGYTISRHTDTSKDFCFKAEKYGARTYYFMTDNRDQLTEWVGALTEAAARSKKRKESFLSVSSHNVSLPALDIRRPECTGFLGKLSPSHRHWRRRYCVLKDACVYYYKDTNSLNALGVAHLHGYKVDVESHPRRKHSFSLQPPDKKMRVFCFSADNETDKKRWVESLIHSIQRWVRVDKEAEC
ncbi:unnamed protein product [Lymnaea stagnalis]|uniref:Uncharacterized protein n=1 Tax=Lymnaea stagnalis TaxID=6523 RepID=A0AAV2I307_LYMST